MATRNKTTKGTDLIEHLPCRKCGDVRRYINNSTKRGRRIGACVTCSKAYFVKKREHRKRLTKAGITTYIAETPCKRCGSHVRSVYRNGCYPCLLKANMRWYYSPRGRAAKLRDLAKRRKYGESLLTVGQEIEKVSSRSR